MYQQDTSAELLRILDMMLKDKVDMLSIGFTKIAEQNEKVIRGIVRELERRTQLEKEEN